MPLNVSFKNCFARSARPMSLNVEGWLMPLNVKKAASKGVALDQLILNDFEQDFDKGP